MGLFDHSAFGKILQGSYTTKERNLYAKNMSVGFFRWNASKADAYIDYLKNYKHVAPSKEIEDGLNKFEGSTIEERYELYLEYLKTSPQ